MAEIFTDCALQLVPDRPQPIAFPKTNVSLLHVLAQDTNGDSINILYYQHSEKKKKKVVQMTSSSTTRRRRMPPIQNLANKITAKSLC